MSEAETNSLADHIPLASPPSSRPSSTPLDDVTEVDSASRDHPLALAASSGSLSPIAHPANIQAESSSLHPFTPLTRGATASSSPTYSISTPLSSDKLTPSSGTSLPSATASPPGRQPSGRPARAVGAIKQRVKRLLGRDGH
ncbi:hypothetical protein BJ165DRAFT_631125 [Panaeolus papilionaceus]|nr:hypothetical protein BJ165DRAFT_631125 [Panaeolus papilionaceus]